MGLKIYKSDCFDDLVRDLEEAYGHEELVSIKLQPYIGMSGMANFWYAVVITKEIPKTTWEYPVPPATNPTQPIPPTPPNRTWYEPYLDTTLKDFLGEDNK